MSLNISFFLFIYLFVAVEAWTLLCQLLLSSGGTCSAVNGHYSKIKKDKQGSETESSAGDCSFTSDICSVSSADKKSISGDSQSVGESNCLSEIEIEGYDSLAFVYAPSKDEDDESTAEWINCSNSQEQASQKHSEADLSASKLYLPPVIERKRSNGLKSMKSPKKRNIVVSEAENANNLNYASEFNDSISDIFAYPAKRVRATSPIKSQRSVSNGAGVLEESHYAQNTVSATESPIFVPPSFSLF